MKNVVSQEGLKSKLILAQKKYVILVEEAQLNLRNNLVNNHTAVVKVYCI